MSGGLPEAVRRFIGRHISSIEQLEILQAARAAFPAEVEVGVLARRLAGNPESIARRVQALAERGWLELRTEGTRRLCRFARPPGTPEHEGFELLARYYASHRVSVVEAIYSSSGRSPLQEFAEAFRIGGSEEEGEGG